METELRQAILLIFEGEKLLLHAGHVRRRVGDAHPGRWKLDTDLFTNELEKMVKEGILEKEEPGFYRKK